MDTYKIKITGTAPLLMHADDVEWADRMDAWKVSVKGSSTQKVASKAGDDRSPAWRWFGFLYNDGTNICVPIENIKRSLMSGATRVLLPGGKMGKTMKDRVMPGLLAPGVLGFPLLVNGKKVAISSLAKMIEDDQAPFERHKEIARAAGFELFVKRAVVGQSKHVRVRPRFDTWAAEVEFEAHDATLTQDMLSQIANQAGRYVGIGDWRPGGRTPGPFGTFTAEVTKVG